MKVAAIQMKAVLADVDANLSTAESLVARAFAQGAEWVILPEFFTSAMAFSPAMLRVARPLDGEPLQMLKSLAAKHKGVVGGSFIAIRDGEIYNTFVLVFPDGSLYTHDKDQPTMWENCYYLGGTDDGILATPKGKVGVALCWEFVRTRTARRLLDRVDFVVGGSCWWTLPEKRLPGFTQSLHQRNLEIMRETPGRFARMLGVPVVHAAHAGDIAGDMPLMPGFPYKTHYLGETQIVDHNGSILARMTRDEGEGFITADIRIPEQKKPSEPIPSGFWIPDLPVRYRLVWAVQNLHGRFYYRRKTQPMVFEQG